MLDRYFVVFLEGDLFRGFYYVSDSDKILNKILKCKSPEEVVEVHELKTGDTINFKSLIDVNDFFEGQEQADKLLVLRDDKWYTREKNSFEFKEVKPQVKSKQITTVTTNEVVVKSDLKATEYEIGILKDEVSQLCTAFDEFKKQYAKEQKLNYYIYIALIALLTTVGVIAIFR